MLVIHRTLSTWSRPRLLFFASNLTVLLFGIDYTIDPEFAFSAFYLAPVLLVSWYFNWRYGAVFAVVGAFAWIGADLLSGATYSHALAPYWNTLVRFLTYGLGIRLVMEIKFLWHQTEALAMIDALTGIANKRHFYIVAEKELARARRSALPLSFAYCDIDNFRTINDTFGHSKGDEVLRLAATIIKQNLRFLDTVARIGGDEFAILLPETDRKSAATVLYRVERVLDNILHDHGYHIGLSIGFITFDDVPSSVDELLHLADEKMHLKKHKRKTMSGHTTGTSELDTVYEKGC